MDTKLSRRTFLTQTAWASGAVLSQAVSGAPFPPSRFPNPGATNSIPGPFGIATDLNILDIRASGKAFAVYNFNAGHAGLYRPFFHPIMGPNDQPITQNGEFPGTLRGHYWHRALSIGHQRVNDVSFWEEREADCGKIVHLQFTEIGYGDRPRVVEQLVWRDRHGGDLLREERRMRFNIEEDRRFIDLTLRFRPVNSRVTFSRTPFSLLACRVINSICRSPEKQDYTRRFGSYVDFRPLEEGGRIVNSDGKVDTDCRGVDARWCDFSGPLGDGTWGGIALLDHPRNPRHPTPWNIWNQMTMMASFTFRDSFVLELNRELALSYRVFVHEGDAAKADVASAWKQFAESDPV